MARRRLVWTSHQLDKLNKVNIILEELKDYKPLTLRQIYYQLVGKGFIERLHKRRANRSINKVNVYRKGSWFNTFLDICKR